MRCSLAECLVDGDLPVHGGHPLIRAIKGVEDRVEEFKERVKSFYFEVVLLPFRCPQCGGRLQMAGQSECACSCGHRLDPTVTFQRSACCGARLVRKTFHYACAGCNGMVPSRFLFDERVFDKAYFREMMAQSRGRARVKRAEIQRLLAESRSGSLTFLEPPQLESIPGLLTDLDEFLQCEPTGMYRFTFDLDAAFRMEDYRSHILSILSWDRKRFSEIPALIEDGRKDKARRFVTLIFMQNDREIDLTEDSGDLLVQRVYHEAYG